MLRKTDEGLCCYQALLTADGSGSKAVTPWRLRVYQTWSAIRSVCAVTAQGLTSRVVVPGKQHGGASCYRGRLCGCSIRLGELPPPVVSISSLQLTCRIREASLVARWRRMDEDGAERDRDRTVHSEVMTTASHRDAEGGVEAVYEGGTISPYRLRFFSSWR